MRIRTTLAGAVAALACTAGLVVASGPQSQAVARHGAVERGAIAVVQAVPGLLLTVQVDGDTVDADVAEGSIVGPLRLADGEHEIRFADRDGVVADATVEVTAGRSSDVVVHRPAEVGGDPVVSVYSTPDEPIGPDKARVLLAHTATTAPADVEVDGTIVFENIANGEFAQADVPAGTHRVALLPSGVSAAPILGPIDVTLEPGTVTAVYAVGNPKEGSMKVIVRVTDLSSDGTEAPAAIDTGSAGLVAGFRVVPFRAGG